MRHAASRQGATAGLGEALSKPAGVVLVGYGAIGGAVVRIVAERGGADRFAAVAVRDAAAPRAGLPDGVRVLTDPAELAGLDAGLVIEVAGRDSVAPWGRAALAAGMDFAVSSTSAFTDAALLDELTRLARLSDRRLIIPPGALGGIDALAAASRMGLHRVEHSIIKPPRAWMGTAAESLCDLTSLQAPQTFFRGTAREAAARFPQNANVAMVVALAGMGPDQSQVALTADPSSPGNRHLIVAAGAFGAMTLQFDNAALPENPKSSATTALSLVRLIETNANGLVI